MLILDAVPQTDLQKAETILKIIQEVVTTLAIITGGVWAYVKFVIQREHKAHIDFTVDMEFHGRIDGYWIVELIAYVENKGKVQHKIQEFDFDVFSLTSQDKVETSEKIGGQVFFPNVITKGSFLPKWASYFFIEPGLKNKYS